MLTTASVGASSLVSDRRHDSRKRSDRRGRSPATSSKERTESRCARACDLSLRRPCAFSRAVPSAVRPPAGIAIPSAPHSGRLPPIESLRSRVKFVADLSWSSHARCLELLRELEELPAELAKERGWTLKEADAYLLGLLDGERSPPTGHATSTRHPAQSAGALSSTPLTRRVRR